MSSLFAPLWVMITGVVRDEVLFLERLAFFDRLRRSGDIVQIVWSSWKGEASKFPRVEEALKQFDVLLVESDEPKLFCRGHFLHQSITLENGIDVCPNDAFIFRTRTDKSGAESGFIEEQVAAFIRSKAYLQRSARPQQFLYRIGTFGYHTNVSNRAPVLFFWNDRSYVGYKRDLKRFLNRNVLAFDYQKLIPEQTLFSSPFSSPGSAVDAFFDAANQSDAVAKILFAPPPSPEHPAKLAEFLCGSALFIHAFLTERLALHECFYDIPTGQPIGFSAEFGGRPVPLEPRVMASIYRFDDHGLDRNHRDEMALEMSAYLAQHYGVEPLAQRRPVHISARHVSYSTPELSLSLTTASAPH